MNTFFISALAIAVLLVGVLLVYQDLYVRYKLRKIAEKKYQLMMPLMQKLSLNEEITPQEILDLVADPSLRHSVFRILEALDKCALFPAVYCSHEKAAESFLACWLEFPTELGIAPDQIELLTKVTITEDESLDYYVFQFRTDPPRKASKQGWMVGVSGPYTDSSKPYDFPKRVFSRFMPVDAIYPEQEAQWVHENINR
jgi:hypothetical protein